MDLETDTSLIGDICDALSELDKVKFTVQDQGQCCGNGKLVRECAVFDGVSDCADYTQGLQED